MKIEKITPITYKEAADSLGRPIGTITQAQFDRSVFTRLPRTGNQKQLVIREQVELFKGKKRLSLKSLSSGELEIWRAYDEAARGYNRPVEDVASSIVANAVARSKEHEDQAATANNQTITPFNLFSGDALLAMAETGIEWKVKTPEGKEYSFQPVLADEKDNSNSEEVFSGLFLWLILLGLMLLFSTRFNSNAKKAERALEQMEIEREDLYSSQKDTVIEKLKKYPQETRKIKTILQEENIIPECVA